MYLYNKYVFNWMKVISFELIVEYFLKLTETFQIFDKIATSIKIKTINCVNNKKIDRTFCLRSNIIYRLSRCVFSTYFFYIPPRPSCLPSKFTKFHKNANPSFSIKIFRILNRKIFTFTAKLFIKWGNITTTLLHYFWLNNCIT